MNWPFVKKVHVLFKVPGLLETKISHPESFPNMQKDMEDRLRRFDITFRTLLVIMSIFFSGSLAFYMDVLDPFAFAYSAVFFSGSIVCWAFAMLLGGHSEIPLKIISWLALMTSLALFVERLVFRSFILPQWGNFAGFLVGTLLTWKMVDYFHDGLSGKTVTDMKLSFIFALVAFALIEAVFYSLTWLAGRL